MVDDFYGKRQVLVSSTVISLASKPFAGMLSPEFLEGQDLSTEDPPIVELAEDEGQPMETLMLLLHHRYDVGKKGHHLDPYDLVQLVVVADKYACLEPIKFQVRSLAATLQEFIAWRMSWTDDTDPEEDYLMDAVSLTIVSYATGNGPLFSKLCSDITDGSPIRCSLM